MKRKLISHNPYFSRWFSAIIKMQGTELLAYVVTILILVDGFLQLVKINKYVNRKNSHNPYFSRWFSAMY